MRNICVHYCLPLAALDLLVSLHVIMWGLTFSPFSMKTRWRHSNQSQTPSQGDGQQLSLGSLKVSCPRESPSPHNLFPVPAVQELLVVIRVWYRFVLGPLACRVNDNLWKLYQ